VAVAETGRSDLKDRQLRRVAARRRRETESILNAAEGYETLIVEWQNQSAKKLQYKTPETSKAGNRLQASWVSLLPSCKGGPCKVCPSGDGGAM